MSHNRPTDTIALTPQQCVRWMTDEYRVWLIPTLVCGVLSLLYALFMTRYWEATQGLIVRDEASTRSSKQPGKFADLYEMRTFQETVLEVVHSPQVLTATLRAVAEDPGSYAPSATDIEKIRKRISMTPPNGAEFGKTEVFYLGVEDPSRDRAIRLVTVLCDQLGKRLGELRAERSEDLIRELTQQVQLAEEVHEAELAKLAAFESEVGADLGELRLLHSASGGQSNLREQVVEMEQEQRVSEARLSQAEELLIVLRAAQQAPEKLVAIPSSLLSFQPTLQRLKEGLLDAQLRASRLASTRTAEHPHVRAAYDSVARISDELHRELAVAIRGLEVETDLSRNRMEVLSTQLAVLRRRLESLAELRAEYSSRVTSVENGRGVLSELHRQLSEVQAKQVAAADSVLVSRLDVPETGPYPVGIGRSSVVALGFLGGFALGIGWLFLTAGNCQPIQVAEVEAESDAQNTDRAAWHSNYPATNATQEVAEPPRQATLGDKFDFKSFAKTVQDNPPTLPILGSPLPSNSLGSASSAPQ